MKYTTQYGINCITYYPKYTAGKIAIVYFSILAVLSLSNALWALNLSGTQQSRIYGVILFSLLSIPFLLLTIVAYKTMFQKICICANSVEVSNIKTKHSIVIPWEDVDEVYIHIDRWKGRKYIKLILKKPIKKVMKTSKNNIFAVSIGDVSVAELEQYIPQEKKRGQWRYVDI